MQEEVDQKVSKENQEMLDNQGYPEEMAKMANQD